MSKTILLAGSSSGIGAETAVQLARRGDVKLGLIARRRPELEAVQAACLEAAAAAGHKDSVQVVVATADSTDAAQIKAAVDSAVAALGGGPVDVLVNLVGMGVNKTATALTRDDIVSMIDLNVMTAINAINAVLPAMRARKQGHIINVSSVLGRISLMGNLVAYSGSKHFLNAYTHSLRDEVKADGVVVATFSPGLVATDIGAKIGIGNTGDLEGCQDLASCGEALLRAIDTRLEEVYSRQGYRDHVASYYAKMTE